MLGNVQRSTFVSNDTVHGRRGPCLCSGYTLCLRYKQYAITQYIIYNLMTCLYYAFYLCHN